MHGQISQLLPPGGANTFFRPDTVPKNAVHPSLTLLKDFVTEGIAELLLRSVYNPFDSLLVEIMFLSFKQLEQRPVPGKQIQGQKAFGNRALGQKFGKRSDRLFDNRVKGDLLFQV
jgi:hypothetical protein